LRGKYGISKTSILGGKVKYKVERNRNFDYIYGEFGTGLLFLVGYLIYELTQKSNIIPLLLFIGSAMVLLFLILFLFILTLKRKFVYINTIDDIIS
jgi:hypothetical protein